MAAATCLPWHGKQAQEAQPTPLKAATIYLILPLLHMIRSLSGSKAQRLSYPTPSLQLPSPPTGTRASFSPSLSLSLSLPIHLPLFIRIFTLIHTRTIVVRPSYSPQSYRVGGAVTAKVRWQSSYWDTHPEPDPSITDPGNSRASAASPQAHYIGCKTGIL